MTEQVPAPVAVLGQVLSAVRAGSPDSSYFEADGEMSGVTRRTAAAGERVPRRR